MTSYVNAFHKFLSTPSARRATFAWARAAKKRERFLSTPSARRATTSPSPASLQICYFYPRPPRGGRLPHTDGSRDASMISIHALREEGDATGAYCRAKADDFYPRPPRGGRPPKNRFG